MHVEHLCLWTRPTFLTVNCIPTGVAMNQDERAPFDRASHRARLSAYPWRLRRSGRLHARQRNPGPGGGGPGQTSMASGQRGANGQPGGSAASDGGAPGIGTRPGAHSVTSQTAGQFDVHLAGNWEATFTAPTQPGEYAFYCTYHPSMKGTLMVQQPTFRWRARPASRRLSRHAQRYADECPGQPAVAQFAHAIAKSRFDIRRRCGRDPFQQLVTPHQGPLR